MRAALFATAALAAGAHAVVELGMCNMTKQQFTGPCQLALSSTLVHSSDELARAAVGSLWFSYGIAVDAFSTTTDGTIVVVTNKSNVNNVFVLPAVMRQVTVGDSVPRKMRSLLQQRELPVCDAPAPAITRAFPETECDLTASSPAPKGCGIVVKSALEEPLSSQQLATTLVGTLRFVFGKSASALQTTTDGQVVLLIEEKLTATAVALFTSSSDYSMGAVALPTGVGKVLSGPPTCTELRDFTVPMVEYKLESESSANATGSTSESTESATEAAQQSAAQLPSAPWAAAAAVWMSVAAAFVQ